MSGAAYLSGEAALKSGAGLITVACPECINEILETKTTEIRDNGVTIATKDGKTMDIEADNVILSVGYKPAPLAPKAKHVHVIGDANKVGSLRTVIWGAWDVAMKL